jgi:hypothetical protein
MTRYHINPETGNPGVCKAKHQCRFGDIETDHFNSKEEAHMVFEKRAAEKRKAYEKTQKEYGKASEASKRLEDRIKTLQYLANEWERNGIKTISPEVEHTWRQIDELEVQIHEAHKVERNAFWDHRLALKEAADYLSEDELKNPLNKETGRYGAQLNRAYNLSFNRKYSMDEEYRPSIEAVADHLSAWSGDLTYTQASKTLRDYDENPDKYDGLTRDEYAISLFQKYNPTKSKKDFVFVDLECTSLDPVLGEIIEMGITRVNNKGEVVASHEELYDLEREAVRDKIGTGWVEGHKITPDMLKGKRKFSDPKTQADLAKHLNDPNVVLVAHNADFERAWLSEHLNGFVTANRTQTGRAYRARALNNGTDPLRCVRKEK